DLVALVRERRGVDRHLRPHAPCGMAQGLLSGDRAERGERTIAERSARRGHGDPADARRLYAGHALPEGRVLAVDGPQALPRPAARRSDEVAPDDEHLLVGERDILPP